jgi:uncharacterized repeat protein (TIGR03803 family)
MLRDPDGNLFGTAQGGKYARGYVFKMYQPTPGSRWKLIDIHDFGAGGDGTLSLGVIRDTQGNLYGTTFDGGSGGGVFYELSPTDSGQWTETVLARLPSGQTIRATPSYYGKDAGQFYDGVSPLYDMTDGPSGAHMRGAATSFTVSGGVWTYSYIYDFCSTGGKFCTDGADPNGGVVVDSAGNLFGVTNDGGHRHGVAFELSPSGGGWSESVLHAFCAEPKCADGDGPGSNMTIDGSGALYGTTGMGGVRPCKKHWEKGCEGVVFKLAPDAGSWDFSVLATFCKRQFCADGARPSQPVLDSSGVLFDKTSIGGISNAGAQEGAGTVFSIDGGAVTSLYSFCRQSNCADGQLPNSPLVVDPSGNLFGTTQNGGPYGAGVIFELTP